MGENVKLSKGKLCSLFMVNAEKWGAKIKWGDANLLSPNFYVLPALSSQLSVFLVVYHEHPFAFPSSAMSVMP